MGTWGLIYLVGTDEMDHNARVREVYKPVRRAESGEQVSWRFIAKSSVPTYGHRHVKERGRQD